MPQRATASLFSKPKAVVQGSEADSADDLAADDTAKSVASSARGERGEGPASYVTSISQVHNRRSHSCVIVAASGPLAHRTPSVPVQPTTASGGGRALITIEQNARGDKAAAMVLPARVFAQ